MSWVKLDDQYPDHPKIVEVGPLGMALHTAATCYCARYLTDGFVPTAMITRLINLDGISVESNGVSNSVSHKKITDQLTLVGLFEIVPGGFIVHDYLKYNPHGDHVKAEREANTKRQAEWRAAHPKKQVSNAVSNGVTNGTIILPRSRTPTRTRINGIKGDNKVVVEGQKNENPAASKPFLTDPADRIWRIIKPGSLVIPPTLRESTIPVIDLALRRNGGDEQKTANEGKTYFDAWCGRRGKDGKYYSPSGRGWIDWWASGEIPSQYDGNSGQGFVPTEYIT